MQHVSITTVYDFFDAREAAAAAVDKLAGRIAEAKAKTMEGVLIKARAMTACTLLGDGARFVAAFRAGHDLAETVARVAAGQKMSAPCRTTGAS